MPGRISLANPSRFMVLVARLLPALEVMSAVASVAGLYLSFTAPRITSKARRCASCICMCLPPGSRC
jgi:hypothetical protein